MPITFDEAYTYLNYVYTKNYFNLGLANNHLLNTILIGVTSRLGSNEIFIRLPNVIFGIIFFLISLKISKFFKNSLNVFLILTLNPWVFDFFSHARGYGISVSLNMLGLYIYIFTKNKYKFQFAGIIFLISSFSIYINLIVLFLFILSHYFFNKHEICNIKTNLTSASLIISSWPVINWVFEVTAEGKPLYGNEINLNLFDSIFTIFGFSDTYFYNFKILSLLLFISIVFLIRKSYFLNFNSKYIFFLFSTTLLSLISIPYLFDKPFPVGRVLLPFVPIFQLFLVFTFANFRNRILQLLISIILIFNFSSTYKFNSSIQWGISVDLNTNNLSKNCEFLSEERPEVIYYINIKNICK